MTIQKMSWCDEDHHGHFEKFADFNEWLNSEYGEKIPDEFGLAKLTDPSKAFFAGDREAYDQAFREYRKERRHEVLCEQFFTDTFPAEGEDNHWFELNLRRFDQLLNRLETKDTLPFVGAGLSVPGGFSSWEDHLRHQGRTAGLDAEETERLLTDGQYETVIEQIVDLRGREVFVQDIRDEFDRNGTIPEAVFRLAEIFSDTIVTTNYDRLIEQAFETGEPGPVQIITAENATEFPASEKTTVVKLHGDIRRPGHCILSKDQYDAAYGENEIDLSLPIPKLLDYYFRNNSLLFLGCSLHNDRTIQVFDAIRASHHGDDLPQHFVIESCPESLEELLDRNAFLARLGLTGIWFETKRYECVEGILRLARNELAHRETQ
ncbi:MAG: SIR2 family protein [Pseudomonadota bacterium]